jgi:Flp pilus assembly protein TadG
MFYFKKLTILLRSNKFLKDENASIAVIFSISLLAVLASIALAIDYTNSSRINAKLQSAADVSALAALTHVKKNLPPYTDEMLEQGKAIGSKMFSNHAANIATINTITPTFKVTQSGGVVKSDVTYNAKINTLLASIIGHDIMSVTGSSTAIYGSAAGATPYVNIYFMLDESASMGIGATSADIAKLENETDDGRGYTCAFACHTNEA